MVAVAAAGSGSATGLDPGAVPVATGGLAVGHQAPCNFTGVWVRSEQGAPTPAVDNMTLVQAGLAFTVDCDSKLDHCTEAWRHAAGKLSACAAGGHCGGGLARTLNVTYPADRTHRAAFTVGGVALASDAKCRSLKVDWGDGTVWCKGGTLGSTTCGGHPAPSPPSPPAPPPSPPPPPRPEGIQDVFVVFSNHLDIGYTMNVNGSCAGAVINKYFTQFFPAAIATSQYLRTNATINSTTRWKYKWMTQSWLVSAYRHCNATTVNRFGRGEASDLVCPSAAELAAFEAAVRRGDITWHAFPHNAEPEMFDAGLFSAALNLTFREDDYYGHARRRTLSQRDVPGLTRATIPLLRAGGVQAVSVGENTACAQVNVPSMFLWRDNATATEVVALFHPKGYGRRRRRRRRASGGNVQGGGGGGGGGSRDFSHSAGDTDDDVPEGVHVDASGTVVIGPGDCVDAPFANASICFAWQGDNHGPHTGPNAVAIFEAVQQMYPGARIQSSDAFDDFVDRVWPHRARLPLVTAEIGDTWIYGADSDPLKVAQFRAASRLRAAWCTSAGSKGGAAATTACDPASAEMQAFDRLLTKVGEHTWGWSGPKNMRTGVDGWSDADLQRSLATDPVYETNVWTWLEQRAFITNAVAALPPGSPLKAAILDEFAVLADTGPLGSTATAATAAAVAAAATAATTTATTGGGDERAHAPRTVLRTSSSVPVFEPVALDGVHHCGKNSTIGFDHTGAITHLVTPSGAVWADEAHPIARLWYQGMDSAYIEDFTRQYMVKWKAQAFGKPGLNLSAISSNMTLVALGRRTNTATAASAASAKTASANTANTDDDANANAVGGGTTTFHLTLVVANTAAHVLRGAMATAEVLVEVTEEPDEGGVSLNVTLVWRNKTACHAPETVWLSSVPNAHARGGWTMDKLGHPINPVEADLADIDPEAAADLGRRPWPGAAAEAVQDGAGNAGRQGRGQATCDSIGTTCGVHLHAVGHDGVRYTGGEGRLALVSLDSALLSVGEASPVPSPLHAPDPRGGIHWALVGNLWNTNYPFWYPFVEADKDAKFRFQFIFS